MSDSALQQPLDGLLLNSNENSQYHISTLSPSSGLSKIRASLREHISNIQHKQLQTSSGTLMAEIRKADDIHQELVNETERAVPMLQDETSKNHAIAQLDVIETELYDMKESVYARIAQCNSKESIAGKTRSRQVAEMLSDLQIETPGMHKFRSRETSAHKTTITLPNLYTNAHTFPPQGAFTPHTSGHTSVPYSTIQALGSYAHLSTPTTMYFSHHNIVHPSATHTNPFVSNSHTNLHSSLTHTAAHVPAHHARAHVSVSYASAHASYCVTSAPALHALQNVAAPTSFAHMSHGFPVASHEARHSPSDLGSILANLIQQQAAPKPTLEIFSGDPLKYIYFRTSFKDVVESNVSDERGRLNRLLSNTSGAAKELVQTCVYLSDAVCYTKALELLDGEYGNRFRIARAFIKQLKDMENVKGSDADSWKKLYRFLLNCETLKSAGHLEDLDRPDIISIVITKLDVTFQDRWISLVERTERTENREVKFDDLLQFVKIQASCVSHPSFSRQALKNFKANVIKAAQACNICKDKKDHDTSACSVLASLSIDERYKKIFQDKLCFSCLCPTSPDHNGKSCSNKLICSICWDNHPTILHKDPTPMVTPTSDGDNKTGSASVLNELEDNPTSMCVVRVRLRHTEDKEQKEVTCYALLDQDCTGCFASTSILSMFKPHLAHSNVSIDTVNGLVSREASSTVGLIVRCSEKHAAKYGSVDVKLPQTFSNDNMPFSKEDMPMEEALKRWKHMEEVSKSLAAYDERIPFGLIIGNNCKEALEPLQLVPSAEDGPFAYRTQLGWCVVGPSNKSVTSSSHKILFTHVRVHTQDVVTGMPTSHYFLPSSKVEDTTVSDKLRAMYETEFSERFTEGKAWSLEDKKFMDLMNDGVKKVDGRYEAPIPFRNPDPVLPSNQPMAMRRLLNQKPKMLKNKTY